MTKDVIELAREAGFDVSNTIGIEGYDCTDEVTKLVALVAARERERCAQLCEEDQSEAMEWTGTSCPGNYFAAAIRALNTEDAAIAAKGGSDG
jgi:hypothetical protein